MDKIRNAKIRPIQETNYGVYIWQMPDGKVVSDDEGRFLSVAAREGDFDKMVALRAVARTYGVTEGKPLFLPGHRKVTDSEYEHQQERMNEGLIPDEYDAGAWKEELGG